MTESPAASVRRAVAALEEAWSTDLQQPGIHPQDDAREVPSRPEDFPGSTVLDRREHGSGAYGLTRRLSLLETDMKYPLIRTEDLVEILDTGEEVLVARYAMAAGHFLVRPSPGFEPEDLRPLFDELGFHVEEVYPVDGRMRVSIPEAGMDGLTDALTAVSDLGIPVSYAEPDYVVFTQAMPSDPDFDQLWGLHNTGQTGGEAGADIRALDAWQTTTGDSSIVVGVIDTGIDYTHPDLAANIWLNEAETADGTDTDGNGYVDDFRGWNFSGNTNDPMDDHYHGTHVAGTVGAVGDNGIGIAGVTWSVRIIPLKFLGSSGGGFVSDAVPAIDYATQAGAHLTCNSWGGGGYSQSLKDAIDRAADAGVLFVAAAGNNGLNADLWPMYPASYDSPNIISVAATDHRDQLAGFSNYGAESVHIAAPGVGIYSTFPTQRTLAMHGLPSDYATISGTSMAAPHVAGAAALLLAHEPGLEMTQLRGRLINRGTRMEHLVGRIQSASRLNLANLVRSEWTLSPADIRFRDIRVTEAEGNGDGYFRAGETVEVSFDLINLGETDSDTVEVSIVIESGPVTVLPPATRDLSAVHGFTRQRDAGSFLLQISPDLTEDQEVVFTLASSTAGSEADQVTRSLYISIPKPVAEVDLDFMPGEPIADPFREMVYILNQTHRRILAIDVEQGTVHAMAGLEGSPWVSPPSDNGSLNCGMIAICPDGERLYVALTFSSKIQVFDLPDLIPVATLDLEFQPYSLAATADGRLFATGRSSYYNSPLDWGGTWSAPVREVDPATGEVLRMLAPRHWQDPYLWLYGGILRTSRDGKRLFICESQIVRVGGPGEILEYDVSAPGDPVLADRHLYWQAAPRDFAVDEARGRIFTVSATIPAVQVTEMDSDRFGIYWDADFVWPTALAFHPDAPLLYAGEQFSLRNENSRLAFAFPSSTGDFPVTDARPLMPASYSYFLPRRGLALTAGGRLLYVLHRWHGTLRVGVDGWTYRLGVVGTGELDIENPPLPPTPTRLELLSTSASNVDGGERMGPGDTVRVRARLVNYGGEPAEDVALDLLVDPVHGSSPVPATHPIGTVGFSENIEIEFTFTLSEGLAHLDRVPLVLRLRRADAPARDFHFHLTVYTTVPIAQATLPFEVSSIIADPWHSRVYIGDRNNARIVAFDPANTRIAAVGPLDGPRRLNGSPLQPGTMVLSPDGTRLYVQIPAINIIQVFALPDLQHVESIRFENSPGVLSAVGHFGRLYTVRYVSSSESIMRQLAPDGAVLWESEPKSQWFFHVVIHPDGTRLYTRSTWGVEEYDLTGASPVYIGRRIENYSTSRIDTRLDPLFGRMFLVNGGQSIHVADLAGEPPVTTTTWPSGSARGLSFAPSSPTVAVCSGSRVVLLDRDSGDLVRDYDIPNMPTGTSFIDRGIAQTPDGRITYVNRRWSTTYTIGVIGAEAIHLDFPAEHPLQVMHLAWKEVEGNGDSHVNPGETWRFTPRLKNVGLAQIEGATITLIAAGPGATVLSEPAEIPVLPAFEEYTLVGGVTAAIDTGLADLHTIPMQFLIVYADGTEQKLYFEVRVTANSHSWVETDSSIGSMVSAPGRNIVYLTDVGAQRLLALDTESGQISAVAHLIGTPAQHNLAISQDGSRLLVPQDLNRVQVFSLPELHQVDLLTLDFMIRDASIMATSDARLYATTADALNSRRIHRLDPETGRILELFGNHNYLRGVLSVSQDEERLYAMTTDSRPGVIGVFAIEHGSPPEQVDTYTGIYAANSRIARWHAIDERNRRFYVSDWPIVFDPSYQVFVYGDLSESKLMAYDMDSGKVVGGYPTTFSAGVGNAVIRRIDRRTGREIDHVSVPRVVSSSSSIHSMAQTMNGHTVYHSTEGYNDDRRYYLGLLAVSEMDLTLPTDSLAVSEMGLSFVTNSPGTMAPAVDLGTERITQVGVALRINAQIHASSPLEQLEVEWSLVSGPQSVTFLDTGPAGATLVCSMAGEYRVRLTVRDGDSVGIDHVQVKVTPNPPQMAIEAADPTPARDGDFRFILSASYPVSSQLPVTLSFAGDAVPGEDYVTLPGLVFLPENTMTTDLPLVLLPTAGRAGARTLQAIIEPGGGKYDLGPGSQATLRIPAWSYADWAAFHLPGAESEERAPGYTDEAGVPNLLRFALGVGPHPADVPRLAHGITTEQGDVAITLRFPRRRDAPDLVYEIMTSSNLVDWEPVPGPWEMIDVTTGETGIDWITVRLSGSLSSRRAFYMLRIRLVDPLFGP